jgi:glycosyltransferase involved in cell wall biosynthesis
MKVSVVLACRNEAKHIDNVLRSLTAQQTQGFDCEFILADGMSTDSTRERIAAHAAAQPTIRMIDNPGRIVATGLNAAIRESGGEVIVRMDAHTEYAPDYVRSCLRVLNRTGADNVGGPARTRAEGLMQRAIATAYHAPFACGAAKFHDTGYEGPVDTVTYGCWRREAFTRYGYFDEALVRNQDDEHNLRIVRGGGRVWQSPEIVSWYWPRSSLAGLFRQYFQYGFWKVAVIRKHRLPASIRHLIPGAFVLWLIASIVTAAAGFAIDDAAVADAGMFALTGAALSYTAAAVAAAVTCPKPYGRDVTATLPVVFAVYHISYGLGFLMGMIRAMTHGRNDDPGHLATEITR